MRRKTDEELMGGILDDVVKFYSDHHVTRTTLDFFAKKATLVMQRKLPLHRFCSMRIPDPKEDERFLYRRTFFN